MTLETDLFGVKTEYRDPGVWTLIEFEGEFDDFLLSGTGYVRIAELETLVDDERIYCEIVTCGDINWLVREKLLYRKKGKVYTHLYKSEIAVQP